MYHRNILPSSSERKTSPTNLLTMLSRNDKQYLTSFDIEYSFTTFTIHMTSRKYSDGICFYLINLTANIFSCFFYPIIYFLTFFLFRKADLTIPILSSSTHTQKMQGQHVLITGAAGGIGLVVARVFLEQGANVSLHYNRTFDTLKPLLNQYAEQCYALAVNATDEKAVEKGVEQSCARFGLINVCIINHATYVDEDLPIWEMSLTQWQQTLDVNLTSYFLYTREWCRQLKRLKPTTDIDNLNASLIIIGSTAGKFGEANHIDYATGKGALHTGFIKSLKNEIVHILPHARCNVVAPGWTRTPMAETAIEQGKHLKAIRTTPLRKVASTEDVAQACLFFASKKTAAHLTGKCSNGTWWYGRTCFVARKPSIIFRFIFLF